MTEKTQHSPNGEILLYLPEGPAGMHEERAWLLATQLMDARNCVVATERTTPQWPQTRGEKSGLLGAVVFNSPGDLPTLRHLRSLGVPVIYYPSLGPVEDGFLRDDSLYEWGYRLATRLKMQAAHVVLVDSWLQAEAAQAMYDLVVPWLVHPGGARPPVFPSPDYHSRRLWAIGAVDEYAKTLYDWGQAHGLEAYQAPEEIAMRRFLPGDIAFLAHPVWHPDRLFAWAVRGGRLAYPEGGLLDSPLPGLFSYRDIGTVEAALDHALAWLQMDAPPSTATTAEFGWDSWRDAIDRAFLAVTPRLTIP